MVELQSPKSALFPNLTASIAPFIENIFASQILEFDADQSIGLILAQIHWGIGREIVGNSLAFYLKFALFFHLYW